MLVAATEFSDRTGAWGDNLTLSPDSYAELSPGMPGSQVTRANATMLGGLAYLSPLQVVNPENGRTVILSKRDVGAGQPLSHTLSGYHHRIDLTPWAERRLGLSGSAIVQLTLLSGPANGQGCTAPVLPGRYVNPFQNTTNLTAQRIDMAVDYDGAGPIEALGDATIRFAGTGIGGNWVCSTSENRRRRLQLSDGPDTGRYVYLTEDVIPQPGLTVRESVRAGQPIATFAPAGASGCIEIGWASGPSPAPIALADGGFQDGNGCAASRTAAGNNMSDLIHALGGPYGLCREQPITGHYP